MGTPDRAFVVASGADAPELEHVKPGYGAEDVAERLRWLRDDVEGSWLLLRQGGAILGWCVIVWSGKESHPEYPDMQDLFVKESERNKGLGSCVVGEVERMARERGHDKLGLAVNPDDNPLARRLYEHLGYRHDGGERYLDGIYDGYEDWVIDLEKQLI